MSDFIKREDVVEALYEAIRTDFRSTFTDSMSLAIAMANNLPSAKPEQKKGKWEYPRKFGHTHLLGKCSVCGKYEGAEWIVLDNPNFCPHCGADMRSEHE